MDIKNNVFGKTITRLRKNRRASRSEVAAATGLTRQTLERYEKGLREPSLYTAQKIAEYYNVPLDSLLKGDGDIRDTKAQFSVPEIKCQSFTVDNKELRNLLLINRTLPLVFVVKSSEPLTLGNDVYIRKDLLFGQSKVTVTSEDTTEDFLTAIIGAENIHSEVGEILEAVPHWNEERAYTDREEFEEHLRDYLAADEFYAALSDDDFKDAVDFWKAAYEPFWKKAIIVLISG